MGPGNRYRPIFGANGQDTLSELVIRRHKWLAGGIFGPGLCMVALELRCLWRGRKLLQIR